MPVQRAQFDVIRWRPWPCETCRGGVTALDFIAGCHEANGALSGNTPDEIIDEMTALERVWLPQWAASCPHQKDYSRELAKLSEGSEHFVYLTENGESVLKLTKPGIFGDLYFLEDGRVNQRCCTPGDYLVRMYLLDLHFGFAPNAVGVTDSGQIVTLQKFVEGDPPTQDETNVFLRGSGLEPVKLSCFIWKRASPVEGFEYWVGDARDENFVKTVHGIVPIDLRMWRVEVGKRR
jgi:hypothetical protein